MGRSGGQPPGFTLGGDPVRLSDLWGEGLGVRIGAVWEGDWKHGTGFGFGNSGRVEH